MALRVLVVKVDWSSALAAEENWSSLTRLTAPQRWSLISSVNYWDQIVAGINEWLKNKRWTCVWGTCGFSCKLLWRTNSKKEIRKIDTIFLINRIINDYKNTYLETSHKSRANSAYQLRAEQSCTRPFWFLPKLTNSVLMSGRMAAYGSTNSHPCESTKDFIHDTSTWSSLSSAKLLVPDAAALQHIRITVHCNRLINIFWVLGRKRLNLLTMLKDGFNSYSI